MKKRFIAILILLSCNFTHSMQDEIRKILSNPLYSMMIKKNQSATIATGGKTINIIPKNDGSQEILVHQRKEKNISEIMKEVDALQRANPSKPIVYNDNHDAELVFAMTKAADGTETVTFSKE